MATRFENGIVVTLGNNNRVIWNGSVVTEGETIAAVGDTTEMKKRYPDAEICGLRGQDRPARFHLRPSPFLFHHGARDGHPWRTCLEFRRNPGTLVVESGQGYRRRRHHALCADPPDRVHPQRDHYHHRPSRFALHAGRLPRPDRNCRARSRLARLAVLRGFRSQRKRRRSCRE